eukprot:1190839-Amphidinium_carterae.1
MSYEIVCKQALTDFNTKDFWGEKQSRSTNFGLASLLGRATEIELRVHVASASAMCSRKARINAGMLGGVLLPFDWSGLSFRVTRANEAIENCAELSACVMCARSGSTVTVQQRGKGRGKGGRGRARPGAEDAHMD